MVKLDPTCGLSLAISHHPGVREQVQVRQIADVAMRQDEGVDVAQVVGNAVDHVVREALEPQSKSWGSLSKDATHLTGENGHGIVRSDDAVLPL